MTAVDVYVDALLRIRLEVPTWHTRDRVQLIVYMVQKRSAASTETSTVAWYRHCTRFVFLGPSLW
jgi:hypothetical protein